MLAIKAGGSVITRGPRPALDRAAVSRLAGVLARLDEPFVLVHGTGSFGKPPARRYGYLSGRIDRPGVPVAGIKASLLELHSSLVTALQRGGVRAVSCPGCAYFSQSGGRPRLVRAKALRDWLSRGFAPVINSDIFPSAGGGFRVVSSDAILAEAARGLRAGLAVFLTGAPGVRGPGGSVVPEVSRRGLPGLLRGLRPAAGDVSGGMRGKLEAIVGITRRGIDAAVLDGRRPSGLLKVRSGGAGGTYFYAKK